MAETLNVNVLVAAKEEYSKQLINSIRTDVYDIVLSIFEDSQKNNIRRELSLSNFQLELKAVPNWTETKLVEKIKRLTDTSPFLMDLVTAIFVSPSIAICAIPSSATESSPYSSNTLS